jgi:polyhydroxybutyrate depolymerase
MLRNLMLNSKPLHKPRLLSQITFACVLAAATGCGNEQTKEPPVVQTDEETSDVSCTPANAMPDVDLVCTVDMDGQSRFFLLTFPTADAAPPYPLVLNFHGYTHNPLQQNEYTDMPAKARAAGFLLATPGGIGTSAETGGGIGAWNAGRCCGGGDDVAFTAKLIEFLVAEHQADPKRIFSTGMSNGGLFSYRLACDLGEKILAIAPVAGADMTYECASTEAVSVLKINGTADTLVPYEGGKPPGYGAFPAISFTAVTDSISKWTARNACTGEVEVVVTGDVTCERWNDCRGGTNVELCTIIDGGHTWPAGTFPAILGKTNQDMDATAYILKFFLARSLR